MIRVSRDAMFSMTGQCLECGAIVMHPDDRNWDRFNVHQLCGRVTRGGEERCLGSKARAKRDE